MQQNRLKAPFPYFGGKVIIADRVWQHLAVWKKEGKCYADDADYDTCQHAWRLLEQA